MKTSLKSFIALAFIGSAAWLIAQDNLPPLGGPGGPEVPGGPGMGHRPPSPIIAVLDVNHDGVIGADEIANASKALKRLDRNGDGELTRDELHPLRPDGPGMDGSGPDGPLPP